MASRRTSVALPYPYDQLDHGVQGVPPLTREPVEVSPSKLDEVRDAARRSGIELVEGHAAEEQAPEEEA